MYLKSLTISNFRKFREEANEIIFAEGCVCKLKTNESSSETVETATSSDGSVADKKQNENKIEINIAPQTTLIVGKNNSGKTTIMDLLDILVNKNGKFCANDFNLSYLHDLFKQYEVDKKETIRDNLPQMQFVIKIGFDDGNDTDVLSKLYQVLSISDIEKRECEIRIKYQLSEEIQFIDKVINIIAKKDTSNSFLIFEKFKKHIDESKFELKYFNDQEDEVSRFNLSDLIELTYIKANNIREENCLTNAFGKIVEYKYNNIKEKTGVAILDNQIDVVNESLSKYMKEQHSDALNKTIEKVIDKNKCQVLLKSSLTIRNLLNTVVRYYFNESGKEIPENQFGLGFTNLIMIVAEILQYMEKYPTTAYNSQINLIAIEEPETFMHPQMQELFINKINEAIYDLLNSNHKNINSQIIITTHSPHILNSKIHSGVTFNNINYVKEKEGVANVIPLDDSKISGLKVIDLKRLAADKDNLSQAEGQAESSKKKEEKAYLDFEFIKKHIIFKISEIFFADAIIFVEGICEYNLLQYYISKDEKLAKSFISIVNIDGAHAKMYERLIRILDIPTLLVTDIDIKRDMNEKDKFAQITSLEGRDITNQTLKSFMGKDCKLKDFHFYKDGNLMVVFQQNVSGVYPTSFEESFILTNKDNKKLKAILKDLKPDIYAEIESKEGGGILRNSFKWQVKLRNEKARFANKLLYVEITNMSGDGLFQLPQYIEDGLGFLKEQLESKNGL